MMPTLTSAPSNEPVTLPATRPAESFQVSILRGSDALVPLREEWTALWHDCAEATEAQTFAWQHLYWKHVARARRCLLIIARDGAGKLSAAAAFEIRRHRHTLLNVLSFSGEHDADYHCILRVPGAPVSLGREMLVALWREAGRHVSCIELTNVPARSWTAEALRAAQPGLGEFGSGAHLRESETYAIPLPATMDEYWAGFSKKTRDRLKGKLRKFQREMQPEFRVATDARNAASLLDEIETVDRSRWGAATKFADVAQRNFLREMIEELLGTGIARVFTLHVGGKCVAFNVGFLLHGSIRFPYLAHDISLPGNYSVGLINNILAIEHCIQNGIREYDLTRGSEGYKSLLGGEPRHNLQCEMYRSRAHRALGAFNAKFLSRLLRNSFTRRIYRSLHR
jgi:CelD/BcsL family acetyltransferase involved in cellulose biosynthesis